MAVKLSGLLKLHTKTSGVTKGGDTQDGILWCHSL